MYAVNRGCELQSYFHKNKDMEGPVSLKYEELLLQENIRSLKAARSESRQTCKQQSMKALQNDRADSSAVSEMRAEEWPPARTEASHVL